MEDVAPVCPYNMYKATVDTRQSSQYISIVSRFELYTH